MFGHFGPLGLSIGARNGHVIVEGRADLADNAFPEEDADHGWRHFASWRGPGPQQVVVHAEQSNLVNVVLVTDAVAVMELCSGSDLQTALPAGRDSGNRDTYLPYSAPALGWQRLVTVLCGLVCVCVCQNLQNESAGQVVRHEGWISDFDFCQALVLQGSMTCWLITTLGLQVCK